MTTNTTRTGGTIAVIHGRAVVFWLAVFMLPCAPRPVHAAEPPLPWWQAETAMNERGELPLSNKPWWSRAKTLAAGQQFAVRSELPGGGQMLVRRERLTRRDRSQVEAIVWLIDDDGDLPPANAGGDKDSDCYVVDYDGDGRADRMVDYVDNDHDGQADEMEIRYFLDGRLRRAWFAVDLDQDGQMWDLVAYEYSGNFFRSDPYGDNFIYLNEYDPERKQWLPHSECPFAFYDTNGDGHSDLVIRVSAVPLGLDPEKAPDYANSVFGYRGPFEGWMRDVGAVNLRYSVDLDGLASAERPLHYDMGYNMIGRVPYKFPRMIRENPLRRPPKATVCIPLADLRRLADSYPAEQTGFSFREYGDEVSPIGDRPRAGECRRWEGVFWTWNRRIMRDTGGPTQEWNTRREFRATSSDKRELYYCRADRRIHLRGASEGWIRVGRLGNREPWGEIRYSDTNGDGIFDRWETYRAGSAHPVRVSTVIDAGVRPLPADWSELQKVYTKELLPESLRANEKLMAAMRQVVTFETPEHLAKALAAATCDSERRYVQDVLRETQFLALRDRLQELAEQRLEGVPDKAPRGAADRVGASTRAWQLVRAVGDLEAAYGDGRYEDAIRILGELKKLGAGSN